MLPPILRKHKNRPRTSQNRCKYQAEREADNVGALTAVCLDDIVPTANLKYLQNLRKVCEQIRLTPLWYQKESLSNKMKMLQIYQLSVMHTANTNQILIDDLSLKSASTARQSAKVRALKELSQQNKEGENRIWPTVIYVPVPFDRDCMSPQHQSYLALLNQNRMQQAVIEQLLSYLTKPKDILEAYHRFQSDIKVYIDEFENNPEKTENQKQRKKDQLITKHSLIFNEFLPFADQSEYNSEKADCQKDQLRKEHNVVFNDLLALVKSECGSIGKGQLKISHSQAVSCSDFATSVANRMLRMSSSVRNSKREGNYDSTGNRIKQQTTLSVQTGCILHLMLNARSRRITESGKQMEAKVDCPTQENDKPFLNANELKIMAKSVQRPSDYDIIYSPCKPLKFRTEAQVEKPQSGLNQQEILFVDDFDDIEIPMNSIKHPCEAKQSVIEQSDILDCDMRVTNESVKEVHKSKLQIRRQQLKVRIPQKRKNLRKLQSQDKKNAKLATLNNFESKPINQTFHPEKPAAQSSKVNHYSTEEDSGIFLQSLQLNSRGIGNN